MKKRILALVVEKTGYPEDMLDLELDLEADLGVDTVKQAEMFAAIRSIYNIPRDENLKLRNYPTLAHVIRFVQEKRPDLGTANSAEAFTEKSVEVVQSPAQASVPTPKNAASAVAKYTSGDRYAAIQGRVLDIVAEKTGYPKRCWTSISILRLISESTQ